MNSLTNRVAPTVFSKLKEIGILKPLRGKRGGRHHMARPTCSYGVQSNSSSSLTNIIPVRICVRKEYKTMSQGKTPFSMLNLTQIELQSKAQVHKPKSAISIGLLNARSVNNKALQISEYIVDKGLDVLAITETWLKPNEESVVNDLCPKDFTFIGEHRRSAKAKRGGGVGVVHRSNYDIKLIQSESHKSFELMKFLVKSETPLYMALVYRPPPSKKNGLTVVAFMEEFELFLSEFVITHDNICILGDFNFHWGKENDPVAIQFQNILQDMGLKQHVTLPTHKSKNILDLVITRIEDNSLENISVQNDEISDHFSVMFSLDLSVNITSKPSKLVRKISSIDKAAFCEDLRSALEKCETSDNTSDILSIYNHVTTVTLDKHAPAKTITLKGSNKKLWYNDEIHAQRTVRRRLERKWKKSKLEIDKQIFLNQRALVVLMIDNAKSQYYKEKLSDANQKESFQILNGLLQPNSQKPLPTSTCPKELADQFAQFFVQKVEKIRSSLDSENSSSKIPQLNRRKTKACLSQFKEVTTDCVRKIINKCPPKSCPLDTIPTSLLKDPNILSCLLPLITLLVNSSFKDGVFPDDLKLALIIPLLKKLGLLWELFQNYRPVSNLPFIGKVMEKAAAEQLVSHLQVNDLFDKLQSAYRRFHGVETCLLKVKSDADLALDLGFGLALVLLDNSAAFDTIDHGIMEERLSDIGVSGKVLKWFVSYLHHRKQSVIIEGARSEPLPLSTGAPQGSVLGPLLYLIYILPLADLIDQHGVGRHGYADDTQLYLRFDPKDPNGLQSCISKLELCIGDIMVWMSANKLKLNNGKTEFMIVAPQRHMGMVLEKKPSLNVGGAIIEPSKSVRNLGAKLDCNLSMEGQVSNIISSMYYHIRRVNKIRKHIDKKTCERVIQAQVISRLDMNNCLLTGIPKKSLSRLQVAHNSAARVITGTSRRDHITPYLQDLHWLPVEQRIIYKCLLIIFKTLHFESSPQYLKDMFQIYKPKRELRSTSDQTYLVPLKSKNAYGARSILEFGINKWNKLDKDIRNSKSVPSFKKHVKTMLFKLCYNV